MQGEYVDPARTLLRAFIYLKTNSIMIGYIFLCYKEKCCGKCPQIFEEVSKAGNLKWESLSIMTNSVILLSF